MTDTEPTTGTKRIPKIDPTQIIPPRAGGKKPYVLYGGLLDAAHDMGLKGITTNLVHIPSITLEVAIVHARVEMPYGTFDGIGDATAQNTGPLTKNALIRMAETRAKARALRDALNAGQYELDGDPTAESGVDQDTGEILPTPTASAARRPAVQAAPMEALPTDLIEMHLKWGRLAQKCYDAGWTADARESVETGKPLIPTLSASQWSSVAEIQRIGREVQAQLDGGKG